ncbi:MAG: hypothetical protein JWO94_3862 [Verrucomicrobiaceae bacterium]|nr:hypothetical protein [Verrucomicrobiaceae bacterium]
MRDSEPQPSPLHRNLLDALSYPFLRYGWTIFVTACACAVMWLLSVGFVNRGILYSLITLLAIVVRCYLTIVENTLTGYGEDIGQNGGLRAEGMWGDLLTIVIVATGSWAPAGLAALMISPYEPLKEPALALLGTLGCEYFCMALIGTVVFGGLQGAAPKIVLLGIWQSGGSYAFASLVLMLVPVSFHMGLGMFASYGFGAQFGAAAFASFVLIIQARLVGLVYLANKERIGWE